MKNPMKNGKENIKKFYTRRHIDTCIYIVFIIYDYFFLCTYTHTQNLYAFQCAYCMYIHIC